MLTPSDFNLPADRFPSFRTNQLETAVAIASSPKRFRLLSAPTGAGKSLISMTAARILDVDRVLYLVGTKGLQEQMFESFEPIGMVDIRGHSNYSCGIGGSSGGMGPMNLVPGKGTEVSEGGEFCKIPFDQREEECEYLQALAAARESWCVVGNYAHWLTLERVFQGNALGDFDLVVIDEAHGVHDSWLARFVSFYIGDDDVKRMLRIDPVAPNEDFLEWARGAVVAAREEYKARVAKGARSEDLKPLEGLGRSLKGLIETSDAHSIQWLLERRRSGVQLSPPWASPYAEQYLFRGIPNVILSSATLTEDTARHLGIPKSEYEMFEMASSFAPKNRPVVWVPTTRIDYRIEEGRVRMLVNKFDKYIESRLEWKGLIQSQSYRWSEEIMRRSRYSEIMISHGRGESRDAVDEFMESSPPAILLSPAIKEGYDFRGDLARWQIIVKIPWVYGKDPIIKARSETDKGYALYLASQDFLQMAGRIVRSEEDFGESVIFDDHFSYFRNKARFPLWFKRAFRVEQEVGWMIEIPGGSGRLGEQG